MSEPVRCYFQGGGPFDGQFWPIPPQATNCSVPRGEVVHLYEHDGKATEAGVPIMQYKGERPMPDADGA